MQEKPKAERRLAEQKTEVQNEAVKATGAQYVEKKNAEQKSEQPHPAEQKSEVQSTEQKASVSSAATKSSAQVSGPSYQEKPSAAAQPAAKPAAPAHPAPQNTIPQKPAAPQPFETTRRSQLLKEEEGAYVVKEATQMELFDGKLLSEQAARSYKILGQVFDTYWLVQYEDKLMFLDQHAAHEKVKYEALLKKIREGSVESQMLIPPMVMNLSAKEAYVFNEYATYFEKMGFEIEDFGGNAVTVRSVPMELFGHCEKDFLQSILDEILEDPLKGTPSVVEEKLASMACKSAVKGNHSMSEKELTALLDQLLALDNPYHCPHGRPTIITMSKYELEKKFRRIL